MRDNDMASGTDVLKLIAPGRLTATGNSTGIDLKDYEGRMLVVMEYGAGGGTTPTLDIKLQESDDNSTFTDISGAAFTQAVGAESRQTLAVEINGLKRYIRAARTITGTSPTFDGAVVGIARKKVV